MVLLSLIDALQAPRGDLRRRDYGVRWFTAYTVCFTGFWTESALVTYRVHRIAVWKGCYWAGGCCVAAGRCLRWYEAY